MALGLAWLAISVPPARAAEVREVTLTGSPSGLDVAFRLVDPLSSEMEERLSSGLELSFEFTIRLRRIRSGFVDRTVSERYVTVSVRYNNLTKMYRLTRQVDATVTDADLTDDRGAALLWLSQVSAKGLFDARDLAGAGTYYVKVKARLQSKFKVLILPWDVETDWGESARIRLVPEQP